MTVMIKIAFFFFIRIHVLLTFFGSFQFSDASNHSGFVF